jgi:hypothetical protein
VLSKILRVAEFDGIGYKVPEDTTMVDVQSLLLEDFLYMFMRPAYSIHEAFFLYKKKNFWSWDCLHKCQIIRISEDLRIMEFFSN